MIHERRINKCFKPLETKILSDSKKMIMHYFDEISYKNQINRYVNYLPDLNQLIDKFNSLEIGTFSEAELNQLFTLNKSNFQALCENRIRVQASEQVEKLGVTKEKLKQKFLEDSILDDMEIIKDLGNFPFSLERQGFTLENGEAFFNESFKNVLKERYTFKPESPNQKKAAELIKTISDALNELYPLVGNTRIIAQSNEHTKPFIRMKGNEVDFVFTEHLKNIR